MARAKFKGAAKKRDGSGFVAIPNVVLDSRAYLGLSHPAKSLLVEIARQFHGDDNGRMVVTMAHLGPRGWSSNDTINRAKAELLAAGLIFETCKGRRPNRASWYAVTWLVLDKLDGFDEGASQAFRRGAYVAREISRLIPSPGVERASIAPSSGVEVVSTTPSDGAMEGVF